MSWNPLDLATAVDRPDVEGYTSYQVHPAEVYPATIARIREALETGETPEELVDPSPPEGVSRDLGALQYRAQAMRVPEEAWDDALRPRDEFPDDGDQVQARAEALELARRWFTRALAMAVDEPLHLHITKDEAYRL